MIAVALIVTLGVVACCALLERGARLESRQVREVLSALYGERERVAKLQAALTKASETPEALGALDLRAGRLENRVFAIEGRVEARY